MNYEKLALAVKQKRRDFDLSMRDVQSQIGISASTLSRIERGNVGDEITLGTLEALCDWLDVSPIVFWGDDKKILPPSAEILINGVSIRIEVRALG